MVEKIAAAWPPRGDRDYNRRPRWFHGHINPWRMENRSAINAKAVTTAWKAHCVYRSCFYHSSPSLSLPFDPADTLDIFQCGSTQLSKTSIRLSFPFSTAFFMASSKLAKNGRHFLLNVHIIVESLLTKSVGSLVFRISICKSVKFIKAINFNCFKIVAPIKV